MLPLAFLGDDAISLLSELWLYVTAVFTAWEAYAFAGVVGVAVGLWERYRRRDIPWPVFKWGLTVFAIVAFFVAWRDQRASTILAQNESAQLKADFAAFREEVQKPKLKLEIDELSIGQPRLEGGVVVHIIANIMNEGAPSIADGWRLTVVTLSGETATETPYYVDPRNPIRFEDVYGQKSKLPTSVSLYESAIEKPIERGMKLRGVLAFHFKQLNIERVDQDGTEFRLYCFDVRNNSVQKIHKWKKNAPSLPARTYPGLGEPPK